MTTETGNAQSEVADPSQVYGLSRWLEDNPLFGPQKTPTATYQKLVPGQVQMGLAQQAQSGLLPWLNDVPEGDGGDYEPDPAVTVNDKAEAPGSVLGGILGGKIENGRVGTNYAGMAGTAGRFAQGALGLSPAFGLAASLGGRLVDQTQANQDLTKMGATQLGLSDYLSSVLNGMTFGIAGNSINDAYASRLRDWVKTAEEEMSINGILDRLNADSYGDYAGGNYSSYISAEDPSYGFGWGGTDQWGGAMSGSADSEGGGWSGGSSERDIDSSGDW